MDQLKTTKIAASIDNYINALAEPRCSDCQALREIMASATKDDGAMWGPSIVGFGSYHYMYDTGREGDWFLTGFSSRKQALTLYLNANFDAREELLEKLGPHKTGKACLYIKSLGDTHMPTLKKLIRESVKATRAMEREMKKKHRA